MAQRAPGDARDSAVKHQHHLDRAGHCLRHLPLIPGSPELQAQVPRSQSAGQPGKRVKGRDKGRADLDNFRV